MPKDFSDRSYEKELLDQDNIPFADIEVTLNELHFINTYLGGYNATRLGLKKLVNPKQKLIRIADVGCGGGHNMIEIAKWCKKRNINVELTGIDMKNTCIAYAKDKTKSYSNMQFITSDYALVDKEFDIIHSCLFTHHLNDEELDHYLEWANKRSKIGVIVNDLHRSFLAYYSIKWLTSLFSRSYLVKNDACLSVLRSFKAKEWPKFSERASFNNCQVIWNWAFRYTTICRK